MAEICKNCGLPKELCACEQIAKEQQNIKILIRKMRYGKVMTIVQGIDSKTIDIKSLMKVLKNKLACGGTFKNNEVELQGEHRQKVKEILIIQGFPEEMIERS